jgi:FkbM family methyltransferase
MNPNILKTDFGVFVMKNDTHLSRWVEQDRRLDHAHRYIAKFKRYIPIGGTVIDCGTSIGDHTVTYASMVGPEGTVLGFEANPDVAECCALNLAIYPNTKIYNVGLSDDVGVAGIDRSDNVGASSLNANGREVMLTPLDQWTKELKRIDFIKVDIEGFEVRFLVGAKETLNKFSPVILMEVNEGALAKQGFKPKDIFEWLEMNHYKWEVVDGKLGSAQYDILARK